MKAQNGEICHILELSTALGLHQYPDAKCSDDIHRQKSHPEGSILLLFIHGRRGEERAEREVSREVCLGREKRKSDREL